MNKVTKSKENGNGFYTVSRKELYDNIESIKGDLSEIKTNLNNHLEHHKTLETKNLIYLGLIVTIVTFLVQFFFNMASGS